MDPPGAPRPIDQTHGIPGRDQDIVEREVAVDKDFGNRVRSAMTKIREQFDRAVAPREILSGLREHPVEPGGFRPETDRHRGRVQLLQQRSYPLQ